MRRVRPASIAIVLAVVLAAALGGAAPALAADALSEGLGHYDAGRYAEAAEDFQALVASSPDFDYGYFMLGLAQLKLDRVADARDSFAKAISIRGDKFEYHASLARAYWASRDYALAVAVLNNAEPLAVTEPHRLALLSLRGRCHAALGEWAAVAADLEGARELGPVAPSELFQLGQAYYKLGRYERAVPVLRDLEAGGAAEPPALVLLADSLVRLGAAAPTAEQKEPVYREALYHAEQLLAQAPDTFEAHDLVGRAALGAGEPARAEEAFRTALAKKPDDCFARINLGKAILAEERFPEAEAVLREAAACAPQIAAVHESLGFALRKQGRLEEALETYRRAFALEPTDSLGTAIEICGEELAQKAAAPDE